MKYLMRILIIFTGIFISQNIFGQVANTKNTTLENMHPLATKVKLVNERSKGLYFADCETFNPCGVILPLPSGQSSPGGATIYTEINIKKYNGIGGGGGIEFMSKERWRWYSTFTIGASYYTYNATATQIATQTINAYWGGVTSTQKNDSDQFNYLIIDFSFKNYLRIEESQTQRLGAGIGIATGVVANTNIPETNPITPEDIPGLCLFISGNLRYDLVTSHGAIISIEPYYNYEVRSVAGIYPRLASFGLKLSLLFGGLN
jgi:predicted small secreted protein